MSFLGAQNSIALGVQGLIHIDTGGGAGGSADYLLAKSLRFRSSASAYLNRTPATAGNQKTWTWSGWVKRGTLGATQNLASVNNVGASLVFYIRFLSTDVLEVFTYNSSGGGAYVWQLQTTQVFRDPAAWYHIVVATDTTQGTASNRVKIYVNGSQITSFAIANYPSASYDTVYNYNGASYVASHVGGSSFYDGELAELNSVDGQALAPTAFGTFNSYNQWQPITYGGSYGTNGFYLPFNSVSTSSYAGSFNGTSQYLSATPATIGSSAFWVEGWLNTSNITTTKFPISLGYDANNSLQLNIDTNLLRLQVTNNSGGSALSNVTMGTLTANTWVYFYFGRGTDSGGTATWYYGINGSITSAVVTTNPTFPSRAFEIGYAATRALAGSYYTGYMSNVRLVVGVTPNTASFTPPVAPLTAISGTAFLTLQSATIVDNSGNSVAITNNGTVVTSVQYPFTLAIAADSSGNANNWTPNNISLTAGSTYDSLTDVPTLTSTTVANYAVLNPLVTPFHYSLQDANLTAVASAGSTTYGFAKGTVAIPIGATDGIYWEIVWTFSASWVSGLGVMEASRTDYTGVGAYGEFSTTPNSIAVSNAYNSGGQVYVTQNSANVFTSASGVLTSGSTMMFALKNGKFYIGINGTWLNSGVPASGTGYMGAVMTADLVPAAQFAYPATTFFANFGQQPFTYTPPTGFLPLNTFNIAAGTVTTSGTFTGNLSTDGPFVFLNGTPTAMTINGNAVTFGTHADKLANGFKVRSSSVLYNLIGSNTYVATTVGAVFKYEDAQSNP